PGKMGFGRRFRRWSDGMPAKAPGATAAYRVVLTISAVGSAVIFSPGMVTPTCASALASPLALPNVQDTAAPGATFSFCSRRRLTSAVASVGTVNDVFRSVGLTRNSFISTASAVSLWFCQRKKALTWPDFLSVSRSGQGNGSLVEALVNTGYASS